VTESRNPRRNEKIDAEQLQLIKGEIGVDGKREDILHLVYWLNLVYLGDDQ
jgi:hypothetical protein